MNKSIILMTLLALCSLQATSEDATEALRRKHAARKIQRMYRDRKEKMDAAQQLQHAWQNYDMMRKMRARRTIRKGLRHGLARRRRDKNLLKKLIIDPQYGPAVTSGGCALDDALRMKMIAAAKHVWKNPKQYRKKGVTQPVSNKVLARQGLFLKTEHPEYWNRIFTDDTSRNVRRALAAYRISEWGPIVHAYRVTRNDLPGREDVIKQGERLKLKSGSWRIQVPRIRLIPRKGTVTPQAAEMSYLKTGKRQNSSPTDDLHYVVVEEKIPFVARHGLEHDMGIDEHGLEQVVTAAKLANTADLHRGNVSVQGPGERAKISMVDIEPMSKFKETVEAGVLERDVKRVRDLDYWQGVSVQEVYQGLNKKGHYGLHPYLSKKSGESKYEYKERLRSRAIDVLTITRISWKTAQKTNNYAVISAIKAEAKKRLSPGHASLVIKWLNSKYGRNIEALLEYEEILTAVGGLQPLVIPEANS